MSVPTLTAHQILAVVLVATAITLAATYLFNPYQALCLGIVGAIITYSFILTLTEKKPPSNKS